MNTKQKILRLTALFLIAGLLKAGFGLTKEIRVMELAQLSIEELISIKVTSVMKTPQSLAKSPAAVYVLTNEEIRRFGATNIVDLLRTVPGVMVAEPDKGVFAVSIRGFNDIHANKLLVMVDGRSVYNHIFSGVFWNHLGLFMEDIERIEVIRGPGSSVWGANAVNGVINIITKNAEDTKGAFLDFACGKPNTVSGSVRYGKGFGDDSAFRIYATGVTNRNDYISPPGFDAKGEFGMETIGFRTDLNIGESDIVSFNGGGIDIDNKSEKFAPQFGQIMTQNLDHMSWHIQSQWQHTFSKRSKTTWQVHCQHEKRVDNYDFKTIDLDFQHDKEWIDNHRMVWGFGYRFITDEMVQGLYGGYTFDPKKRDLHLFSFFVQDSFDLIPDTLGLTFGSKFEHNDFTGFEIQPSIRLSWTPHKRHVFWGAVSRAVRTPSRVESDATSIDLAKPPERDKPTGIDFKEIRGDDNFDSEDMIAYEMGFKTMPFEKLWLDIALFYNEYDNLATYRKEEQNDLAIICNEMEGETYGMEISVDTRPFDWLRLTGTWSFMNTDMRQKDERAVDLTGYLEDINPRHQFTLHSAIDLSQQVKFDLWMRHVDEISHMGPGFGLIMPANDVAEYTMFDLRVAWKPVKNIELSVTGRNLGESHQEFTYYEVEQSIFVKMKIKLGK